jgi:hypothetical protein
MEYYYIITVVMMAAFVESGCTSSDSSTQQLATNQMLDRQTAGQERTKNEQTNAQGSSTTPSGSISGASISGTKYATLSSDKPSSTAASNSAHGMSNVITTLTLTGIAGMLLGPSFKSGTTNAAAKLEARNARRRADTTKKKIIADKISAPARVNIAANDCDTSNKISKSLNSETKAIFRARESGGSK